MNVKYIKKTGVFRQISDEAIFGKEIKGIIRLERLSDFIKITAFFTNLTPCENNYRLFLLGNERSLLFETDEKEFYCEVPLISFGVFPFCAGLFACDDKYTLVAKAVVDDCDITDFELTNAFARKQKTLLQEKLQLDKTIDDYADEMLATENYYEQSDVDFKNLKVIENAPQESENENAYIYDKPKKAKNEDKNNANFDEKNFFTDKTDPKNDDISRIFNDYPRFEELEQLVYGSKWVKIQEPDGEYYFGIAVEKNKSYYCFAVRGVKNACPQKLKDISYFVPLLYDDESGFYVVFEPV